MKKMILLSCVSIAMICSLEAATETVNGYRWTYRIENASAKIISSDSWSAAISPSPNGAVTIPSTLGGYTVTSIGVRAFYGCSGLTSVTIPNSVTNISSDAFNHCMSLTNVLVALDNANYSSKNGLLLSKNGSRLIQGVNRVVTIPDSVTSIGYGAFYGCSGLTSVTIPGSVTSIGWEAFYGCTGLTSVTIPGSVTSIGERAFSGCSGLASVTIPDSITSIGQNAFAETPFYNNQPDGLVVFAKIVYRMKGSCPAVVTIPNNVVSIGPYAFYNCSGLTSVTIPDSVTSIGLDAFSGCSGLTSVTIGNCVTNIGSYAFSGCSGLASVIISPARGLTVGYDAFSSCNQLGAVMTMDLAAWCEIDFPNRESNPLAFARNLYYMTNITNHVTKLGKELIVPDGVGKIGSYAFNGYDLTNVVLSATVTNIMASTFYNCTNLTSVTIPDSVTSIGAEAFYGCSGLTSVTIPDSVTSIGAYAFYYCSGLTSVTIPDSVTSIGKYAFYYCSGLTSAVIGSSVTSIGSGAFSGCSGLTSVTIPDSVTSIGSAAFSSCSGLSSVTIPNSVTSIGSEAFYGCSGLTSTVIGSGVRSIGSAAFSSCSGLSSVTIPDSVTSIESRAFSGCSGLTSVTIPDSVTSIGEFAFSSCNGLKDVTVPQYVLDRQIREVFRACSSIANISYSSVITNIGDAAFCDCSGLTSVMIPGSVTSIGSYAFTGCSGLTSVSIPASVTSIGSCAFSYCDGLKWVVVPASVTSIGANAFDSCSSLKSVYLLNSIPPATGGNIYSGTPSTLTTFVPEGSTGWLFPNLPVMPETWPTGDDDNGRAIEFGSPVFVDVTFDANGGEAVGTVQSITWLVGMDGLGSMPGAMRDGYSFLGWFTDREAGEIVTASSIVTADMKTLYAHWVEGVAFSMGGNADWTQEMDGSWRSGAIGNSQTTWMETTVYGAGEVSFRWKVSSRSSYGRLYFYVDGTSKENISGTVDWTDKIFVVSGEGEHKLRWAYTKTSNSTSGSDCGWCDAVTWSPYEECIVTFDPADGNLGGTAATQLFYKGQVVGELPVPTKNGYLFAGWWTEGDVRVTAETVVPGALSLMARWEVNPFTVDAWSNWAQDGDGEWRSGVTAHNATNSISMPVSGAGTIAFNWKTSCEGFYRTHRLDYLAFFIDGSEQDFINDETGWKAREFNVVGSGDHTLTWSYIKDSEGTAGQDCAWLRDVTWTPADVSVDIGGGKSVTVPGTWIAEHENLVRNNGGSVSAALASTAANGRLSVAECYVVGVDPESTTNDFKITAFPMKADGTPDLENIVFDPPEAKWNVEGARPVVKGAASLDGEWQAVTEENKAGFRFFKVEVVLP